MSGYGIAGEGLDVETLKKRATKPIFRVAQRLLFSSGNGWAVSPSNKRIPGGRKMELIKALWKDEQGASMAEYALLMALIAVATIGAITALRDQIISIFNDATTTLSTAS